MNKRLACALCAAIVLRAFAAPVSVDEFAWRGTLAVPAGASLVRVQPPASALLRLQSAGANDVRVFNAAGEPVPFAWISAPAAPAAGEEKTPPLRALPLYATVEKSPAPKGSVQVHIGGAQPVWVRIDGRTESGGGRPLASALFATKEQRKPLAAIDVQATLPANMPVRVTAWTSPDLANWTPAPVRGRLYRFEGEGAPANLRLQFEQPLPLEGRYLRLDWNGQDAVAIAAITGVVATAGLVAPRLEAPLPAMQPVASDTSEIATGFATPMAALVLATPRENTLLPVRVLGRSDVTQPWRLLGQTVVYRLGNGADTMTNPPLELHGASVRFLRIVSTQGAALAPAQLQAHTQFEPRQLVFVASGSGPFTLVAGREQTDASALPAATLTGMLGARKLDELPLATAQTVAESTRPASDSSWWVLVSGKSAALWAVLVVGVLLLGGVSWSLMRQMKGGGTGPA